MNQEEARKEISKLQDISIQNAYQGKFEKALEISISAGEIAKTYFGENSFEFACCQNSAGVNYSRLGQYKLAEKLMLRSLEIVKEQKGKKSKEFAFILNDLGVFYAEMGDYLESIVKIKEVINIKEEILGAESPDVALSIGDLAGIYHMIERHQNAEELCTQALTIIKKSEGKYFAEFERIPSKQEYLTILGRSVTNLACLKLERADYNASMSMLLQAKEILTIAEKPSEYGNCLAALASLYREIGDYEKAKAVCLEAKEITETSCGKRTMRYATDLLNLAVINWGTGNLQDAEELCSQAGDIIREFSEEESDNMVGIIGFMAAIQNAKGNFEKALDFESKAVKICRNCSGEKQLDLAKFLNNRGTTLLSLGKLEEAESSLKESIQIYDEGLELYHPAKIPILNNLADVAICMGNYNEAFHILKKVVKIIERKIWVVFSFASERQRLLYLSDMRKQTDRLISFVCKYFSHDHDAISFLCDYVLKYKGVSKEIDIIQRELILKGKYPELTAKLQELNTLRMQITKKEMEDSFIRNAGIYEEIISEWKEKKESLESELAARIPELTLDESLHNINHRVIAEVMPKETLLVEIIKYNLFDFQKRQWGDPMYLAFAIQPNKSNNPFMVEYGEAAPIDTMITEFVSEIKEDELRIKERLFESIIVPLQSMLQGMKNIWFATDGEMALIPMELLGKKKILFDEYDISYLSAGRDVVRLSSTRVGIHNRPIVAADPDFNLSSGPRKTGISEEVKNQKEEIKIKGLYFKSLKGFRDEGICIGSLLGVKPWLGEEVLEQRIKNIQSPVILHISTHGYFLKDKDVLFKKEQSELSSFFQIGLRDSGLLNAVNAEKGTRLENPLLRSGLALSGANTWITGGNVPPEAEDGLLSADDVAGINLLDTELVVLSGCMTGIGQANIGEGIFGFRRSFVIAGAKTLIVSLWEVPDIPTRELMENFYNLLLKGYSRSEALRMAKIAIRERYHYPFFWAAFICQGDPSPLPETLIIKNNNN